MREYSYKSIKDLPLNLDDALIIVKLRWEFSGLAVPQLVRFFRKLYHNISKPALVRRVHRALDRLESEGLVVTEKIGSYRFARLTEVGLKAIPAAVDLINSLACTKPVVKVVVNDYNNIESILLNVGKASEEWFHVARKLLPRSPDRLEPFDKEFLALSFETWKDNTRQKVLVFVDNEGNLQFLPYRTRFTSENYARMLLVKFDYAWRKASEEYNVAVFVTITLPPVIPLHIQRYAMSFLWHRIKAYLRKHYGFNPPHILANEPHDSLSLHRHAIIFGIPRIMDKREFTRWLDQHLINFLSNMGHHIKMTVNNRLRSKMREEEVKALNKLGKKILKRYLKYKRKHKRYQGPINWLCKLVKKGDFWEWENPPPDYVKFLEERKKQEGLACDGASPSPSDYIKKYLVKNLSEIIEDEKRNDEFGDIKENKRNKHKLAWYWLMRQRFYSVSPKFRMPRQMKSSAGWEFIGSWYKDKLIMEGLVLDIDIKI